MNKKIIILICSIIGLVVILGILIWYFRRPVTIINFESKKSPPIVYNTTGDQDQDGVLDVEELKQGLSTRDYDTDGDSLSDQEEINTYKTDPKKEDTDGDGFWDGYEVINGYNPLGEGKLKL